MSYLYKEDCDIVRNAPSYSGKALLMDCDGNIHYEFDEYWSDDQIWEALKFANKTFEIGRNVGREERSRQFRKLLNV